MITSIFCSALPRAVTHSPKGFYPLGRMVVFHHSESVRCLRAINRAAVNTSRIMHDRSFPDLGEVHWLLNSSSCGSGLKLVKPLQTGDMKRRPGKRIEGATGCPSWCRPLRPLFHFPDDVSYPQSALYYTVLLFQMEKLSYDISRVGLSH